MTAVQKHQLHWQLSITRICDMHMQLLDSSGDSVLHGGEKENMVGKMRDGS